MSGSRDTPTRRRRCDRASVTSPSVDARVRTCGRSSRSSPCAGSSARFGAGEAVAVPSRWSQTGCQRAGAVGPLPRVGLRALRRRRRPRRRRQRCTCPSRVHPCKHVVALLVLWVRGHVGAGHRTAVASPAGSTAAASRPSEHARRRRPAADLESTTAGDVSEPSPVATRAVATRRTGHATSASRGSSAASSSSTAGSRTACAPGSPIPSIARFATWDEVARRLTDARAGALANRVRRLAGRVGAEPDWHEHVLAEIGHAAPARPSGPTRSAAAERARRRRRRGVRVAGAQGRRRGVGTGDRRWLVAGRSDTREDLVEVRRVWLRGMRSRRMGDGAVVRRLSPGPRHVADGRARSSTPTCTATRARRSGRSWSERSDVDDRRGSTSAAAIRAATSTVGVCELGRRRARRRAVARARAGHRHRRDHPLATAVGCSPTHAGSLLIAPESARSDAVATLLAASCGQPAHDGRRVDPAWRRAAHRVPRRPRARRRPARRPELRERGMSATLADTWDELVTVGLLGTDRRDPPELPPGPLADTVADALRPTPAGPLAGRRRRHGRRPALRRHPLPPRPLLQPPEPDDRPLLPHGCRRRAGRSIVAEWPVLEAEWLAVAAASGWRPAPDVLVAMLRRHRRSPVARRRRAGVGRPGGDVARRPRPRPRARRRSPAPPHLGDVRPAAGAGRARTAAARRRRRPGRPPRRRAGAGPTAGRTVPSCSTSWPGWTRRSLPRDRRRPARRPGPTRTTRRATTPRRWRCGRR